MSRLPPLTEMSAEQQAVYDAIQSGPRGKKHGQIGLVGPFGVWVRAPQVGAAIESLGAAARFNTSLSEDIKEIAICTVGAHFKSKFEFAAHRELALQAGIADTVITSIHAGNNPQFESDDQRTSHEVARQLLLDHRVDDQTYAAAISFWGEQGVIELITIIGYYCMVSLTLNMFEIPVTGAMQDPWPDLS